MPSNSKPHFHSSAAATRPEISPKEEAEICELPVVRVRMLREKLVTSEPGPRRKEAIDECVKWLSISLQEAAVILGVRPKDLSARNSPLQGVFQHKGKWRIWMAAVRDLYEDMKSSK
jgi:hypothetical protein